MGRGQTAQRHHGAIIARLALSGGCQVWQSNSMSLAPAPVSRLLAPVPPDRRARRMVQLLAGLVGYGVTASMMVLDTSTGLKD